MQVHRLPMIPVVLKGKWWALLCGRRCGVIQVFDAKTVLDNYRSADGGAPCLGIGGVITGGHPWTQSAQSRSAQPDERGW
jgi:hypothetical protein